MTEPADLSLTEAADAVARRELTPVELTESCLRRTEALDDKIHAWVTVDEERAIKTALDLTDELASGQRRGPLHGLPVGIKDLIDVAGLPTTASSNLLKDNVARQDAPVVARLRAAGTVIMGKTNTHEFAYGVVTPPTRNPWDLQRIPGGSSGGSAAAVAAGMCLGALGTDTAGSIRIPASLCGISGIKPANGSLAMEGVVPLAPSMDCVGPLARTVADLMEVWTALRGSRSGLRDVVGRRIGIPHDLSAILDVDGSVANALDDAIEKLEAAGYTRHSVALPPFSAWDEPRVLTLMAEALAVHRRAGWYPKRADDYTQETRASLASSESISPHRVALAQRELERLKARFMAAFEGADVLVLPSTPIVAPPVQELRSMSDGGRRSPVVMTLTRVNGPINCCRLASVSVCCGFTQSRLPIGMQLVSHNESTALGVARRYQEVTDFHEERPPLAQ